MRDFPRVSRLVSGQGSDFQIQSFPSSGGKPSIPYRLGEPQGARSAFLRGCCGWEDKGWMEKRCEVQGSRCLGEEEERGCAQVHTHWHTGARYLPDRVVLGKGEPVRFHGLSQGHTQPSGQESRQTRATGREEVGTSPTRSPRLGTFSGHPTLPGPHWCPDSGAPTQGPAGELSRHPNPARALRQMAARSLPSSQTPYTTILVKLTDNGTASPSRGPVGLQWKK